MAIDALTLSVIVAELNAVLSGGKINKITQPLSDTVIFNVYRDRQDFRLILAADSSSPKFYIGGGDYINPAVAPSFCMHLRKHILNAEILSISMPPYERAVKIALKTNTEFFGEQNRTLVFELMGRYSNIFLLTPDGIISDCLKKIAPDLVESARNALPGLPYIEPPEPPEMLCGIRGISRTAAGELAARAKISGREPLAELERLRAEFSPVVYLSGGVPTDFGFTAFGTIKGERKHFPTMHEAMQFFYRETELKKSLETKRRRLESVIQRETVKNEKTKRMLESRLADCANIEQNRIFGDLITANIYKIKSHDTELVTENFYADNAPVTVPLDKALTGAQNAQRYYKKYNKQKKTLSMTEEQLREIGERLAYLGSVRYSLSAAEDMAVLQEIEAELVEERLLLPPKITGKIKKTEQKAPSVMTDTHGGFTIFAGKNNIQNEYVTFRVASENDLWFHVKDAAGSHVIVKSAGKLVPDDTLFYAAQLAAEKSALKGGGKIAVDYCPRKFVKKSRSGIGRVYYTDYKTIIV